MISKKIREKMDPEVYEFYKPALEGNGFSFPFDESQIPAIREDEVSRHERNLEVYPCDSIDLMIDREGADPLPVRIYQPSQNASKNGNKDGIPKAEHIYGVKKDNALRPVILYFHGGGFVMGSIYDHDPLCGKLSDECDAVVISVEYRLAPEYPFPACIDDAVTAAKWAHEHARDFGGDPEMIMAGGDSSGANISAVLAWLAKENAAGRDAFGYGGLPLLKYLILFYGVYGCMYLDDSPSAKEFGNGDFVLPNDMMMSCMDMYLPRDDYPDGIYTKDPRLTPGQEDLSDFPPSIVVSAEFDPLRSDSEEFAKRLDEAGNKVELAQMDGMMHGFILYWQNFGKAEKLLKKIGKIVRNKKYRPR